MLWEVLQKRNVLASSVAPGSLCEGGGVREVKSVRGMGEGKKDENIPGRGRVHTKVWRCELGQWSGQEAS